MPAVKLYGRELTPHDTDPPAVDIGDLFDAEVKRHEKASTKAHSAQRRTETINNRAFAKRPSGRKRRTERRFVIQCKRRSNACEYRSTKWSMPRPSLMLAEIS